MSNQDIERLIKQEHIYKWQIARKIGIHETSFVRWFRDVLTEEQVRRILSAIQEIKLDRLKEQK